MVILVSWGGLIHISNITRGGVPPILGSPRMGPVSHIPKGSEGLINFNTGSDPSETFFIYFGTSIIATLIIVTFLKKMKFACLFHYEY